MRRDPIVIREWDEAWPARFDHERRRLTPLLGDRLTRPIEHIGSTAVPGLPAKPIIDMVAVVDDVPATRALLPRLDALDWRHAPEPGDAAGRRLSLCAPSVERRAHHLHVVEHDSPGWRDWLAFRDHLRRDPCAASAYAALKRRLAAAHGRDPNERAAYRDGKSAFVADVLARTTPPTTPPPPTGP